MQVGVRQQDGDGERQYPTPYEELGYESEPSLFRSVEIVFGIHSVFRIIPHGCGEGKKRQNIAWT